MSEEGSTLKERLAELEKVAIDFEKRLQLDKIKQVEIDLEINRETLSKMDPVDINIMCMEWAGAALYIQKELNVGVSRLNWVESVLERYVGEQVENYKGYGFLEKKGAVMANDGYAKKLHDFRQKCKLLVDRNSFITTRLEFLIKMAQNLAYAKRGEKDGN